MIHIKGDFGKLRELILKGDTDYFHVNWGRERTGKSTAALWECVSYDPKFTADQIGFEPRECIKIIKKSNPGDCILIDEGAMVFFSRDSTKKDQKQVMKFVTVMGQYNNFVITNIPALRSLDVYLRSTGRIRSAAHIWQDPNSGSRGHMTMYAHEDGPVPRLLEHNNYYGKKRKQHKKVIRRMKLWSDTFPKMESDLWNEYVKRKKALIDTSFDMSEDEVEDKKVYSIADFGRKVGKTRQEIYRRIKTGKLPHRINLNDEMVLTQDDYLKYLALRIDSKDIQCNTHERNIFEKNKKEEKYS